MITVEGTGLSTLIAGLPQREAGVSFGADIDDAHAVLLDPDATKNEKETVLRGWLQRYQPCLFGRLAARQARGPAASKGLAIDVVIVDEHDLDQGDVHVTRVLQHARRQWKDRAARGESSAFMMLFTSPALAHARPSEELATVIQRLAGLYLPEVGGIERDVVYTEALPLRDGAGECALFKASTQLFYSGAHLMRNHDRRFPGGVAIVVNAPGHYARTLVQRGIESGYTKAVDFVHSTAVRSIGNGGIAHPERLGSSWHHEDADENCPEKRSQQKSKSIYAATYQVDVLVQSDVVTDARPRFTEHRPEDVWPAMHLEYISAKATPPDDPDFGWFNGLPVEPPARYANPWLPRQAENSPDFNY
jgi:hypothetical protein